MKNGRLSLQFRHPTRDLRYLENALGLPQSNGWVAGEPRVMRDGSMLPAMSDNYWHTAFSFNQDRGFKGDIVDTLRLLKKEDVRLNELVETDGNVMIYLQFQGIVNNGDTITPSILREMGELGINLSIEIFPIEQNWGD